MTTPYRPDGSLQAALEEVFPEQFIAGEPLSGILTFTTFALLTGMHTISNIGDLMRKAQPAWRKASGLTLGKRPSVNTFLKIFSQLDITTLEQSLRLCFEEQGTQVPSMIVVWGTPSHYPAFDRLRSFIHSIPEEERDRLYNLIMRKGGWEPTRTQRKFVKL